jgi:tetratricopeptide (TPR) repeat protein/tRNA A-37 threonylcarbamoyl transferase component Bud32
MDTDRNLLFAVLALQADLVDGERFVQACTLWAGQKERPIAELLIELGWLTPDDRADVERLLDRKLKKHGGDVQASLADAAGALARSALASVADADVVRSVAALSVAVAQPNGVAHAAGDLSTVPPTDCAGRNLLYEEIGRGGIGRVLRGRDPELHRDLAVKVLRDEYRDDVIVRRRFIEEAQIGGQLQHPGLAPIYELGRFADQRPYFTMKLVKGRTLADLLKERSDPGRELPRLLSIFEQVCQTVGFAHSKGVIHRDLKPSNIMVGAFGEVQVMDWGLAKVLGSRNGDPEATTAGTVIRTARSDSTAEEDGRTGVVGTPAYMAPEQARGETDAVDERADVFGLGAILCVLLSGEPPFACTDRDAALRQSAAGDLADALGRLGRCGADGALIGLARQCLATERSGRPRDAGEVAAAMAAYQVSVAERLRQAELERAAAEARSKEAKATAAAERKARQRTAGMALALLLVALAGGIGVALWQKQQADVARREGEQRQAVWFALEKSVGLREQLRFFEAATLLEQARRALGGSGPEELRRQLEAAEADVALASRLDAIRQRLATWAERAFDFRTADHDYAAAFREAGLGQVGDDEEAVAARVRASSVSGALVAALDEWAVAARTPESRLWVLGVVRRADPNPLRDRLRDPASWWDRQKLRELADEVLRDDGAKLAELSPQALESLGWRLPDEAAPVLLLRAAQLRYPTDFWLNFLLANALRVAKQFEEAVAYYRVAIALRPDVSAAHNNLGALLHDHMKDLDGAIAEFRRALELDPKLVYAHCSLGLSLREKGDLDGAIVEYRKALEIAPNYAVAQIQLGLSLRRKGDVDGAIAAYKKAVQLDSRNAAAHSSLGRALHDKGDLDGAIAEHRRAIELEPKLAYPRDGLGIALCDKGDLDGGIAEFRTAIELDPKLANPHNGLGNALSVKGDLDGAIAEFRKAIELAPDHAPAHNNLGLALHDKGDLDGAIVSCKKAIVLDPKLANPHNNLGLAFSAKGDWAAAIAEYRKALELDPNSADARCNLGCALRDEGKFLEGLEELRRGHALGSRRRDWHHPSGTWLRQCERLAELDAHRPALLRGEVAGVAATDLVAFALIRNRQGQLDEAIALLRHAIALQPDLADAHGNLSWLLQERSEWEAAAAEARTAIRINPNAGWYHNDLGWSLQHLGRPEEAAEQYRIALQFDPRHYKARINLTNLEQWLDLLPRLEAVRRCEVQPIDAAEKLKLAKLCHLKRLTRVAAALCADAFMTDTKAANDLDQGHRYDAACYACLAACGEGVDCQALPDRTVVMLRRQTLRWLRDDLAQMAVRAEPPGIQLVRDRLRHWQGDIDLAGVRESVALDKLPNDERQQWRQLWDDVAALLKKVEEKK